MPRDLPEQRDRVVDGQHVEGQRASALEVGQPAPGGDQDQALACRGQQRPDLVTGGGVVENHDGAAAAQLGPPQRGALAGGVRDLGGRRAQHPEQAVQRLGRVE